MSTHGPSYRGYRFPPPIISHVVWLYYRFSLSLRDVEDVMAERGILVSYETVRQWCRKFGPAYARAVRRRSGRHGDTWYLDEVFVTIKGRRYYLWRAMDQDGDTLDILLQSRRNQRAAHPRVSWLRTSLPVTRRHGAPPCLRWCMSPRGVPTTGPKGLISRRVVGSVRCGVSNPLAPRSASWSCTRWSGICSDWVGTCSARLTTGSFGCERSRLDSR